jgi:hypothetical protein
MGTTVAGPVPIIVANAVAVPMTYCFDVVVRSVSFTKTSLLGAIIVVVSFVLLNLYEHHIQSAAARQTANVARLRRAHTLETNLLLETSPTAILSSFDANPYGQSHWRSGTFFALVLPADPRYDPVVLFVYRCIARPSLPGESYGGNYDTDVATAVASHGNRGPDSLASTHQGRIN